ncbi:MAG: radical SAM protein [Candidatus Omnitrophota bacterium]
MNAKKIVLLDPLTYLNGSFRHYHFVRDWSGARLPADVYLAPLDLMYAAAYLRQHGHQVKVIEASAKHLPHAKLVEIVKQENPDFVLIPSVNFGIESDKYLACLIRKVLPKVKIIFSGALVTYDPSNVLLDHSADFVAIGELELPLLKILNGDYTENIAYLDSQGSVNIAKRRLLDLDELPLPARDLIDNQAYKFAIFNRKNPITAMTISRGCPYGKCEFCHTNLYTLGQIRYRNFDAITAEILEVAFKYKIGEISFRDQVFTANREFVFKLCNFLISHKINIAWRAETRVDLVDSELLALMRKAGCYQLSFGFESCSQKSLDLNNKGIKLEQSRQAALLARQAGIEVVGLFLYGMPGDTKKSMNGLVKFALDLKVDYANFEAVYFMPGSPVYEKMLKGINPDFFSKKTLKTYVRNAYTRFYLHPAFIYKHLLKIFKSGSFSQAKVALRVAGEAFLFFLSLNSSPFGIFNKRKQAH